MQSFTRGDSKAVWIAVALSVFLFAFLVLPIGKVIYVAFQNPHTGALTLLNFADFFNANLFTRQIRNYTSRMLVIIVGILLLMQSFILEACIPVSDTTILEQAPEALQSEKYFKTEDIEFTVAWQQLHRINIYAEEGNTIEMKWRQVSGNSVCCWWIGANGNGYPDEVGSGLFFDEQEIKNIHFHPPLGDQITPECWIEYEEGKREYLGFAGSDSGKFNIKVRSCFGGSGYYTFCFKPYGRARSSAATISVHYKVY